MNLSLLLKHVAVHQAGFGYAVLGLHKHPVLPPGCREALSYLSKSQCRVVATRSKTGGQDAEHIYFKTQNKKPCTCHTPVEHETNQPGRYWSRRWVDAICRSSRRVRWLLGTGLRHVSLHLWVGGPGCGGAVGYDVAHLSQRWR